MKFDLGYEQRNEGTIESLPGRWGQGGRKHGDYWLGHSGGSRARLGHAVSGGDSARQAWAEEVWSRAERPGRHCWHVVASAWSCGGAEELARGGAAALERRSTSSGAG